ncbi:molybdopterin/thiamine biosynthesis adenylyltransferase [Rahnella sp. BIGb0236]|uniref:HesA/MoeB/ThiF family protein n=1 Tax=Rahnella sp. BIGb0236 TaxID=2485117 RepID=UPI00105FB0AD|nr:ThiF family adenylyltransferase [Rahnella sp. BIGb0236]TDS95862.1 molybdopterin/thiamine biosynthesis adenylyltransferase [Rahnella sp. BIGb0236]
MFAINKLRLRESVGIIPHEVGVDFFKSNIRENISLRMNFPDIINMLKYFDGKTSIEDICEKYGLIDNNELEKLAEYLKEEFVLIEQDVAYPIERIEKDCRLINLLEDYFHSTSEVLHAINRLKNANVMIIGLGAVGSVIATYLAKLNVGHLVLVDNDEVDLSNLHRQYYFENHVGLNKAITLGEELKNISPDIKVSIIKKFLSNDFFEETEIPTNLNLIINCSDEPSVDVTSRIISKYAMRSKIPHIVGGGYNLHLTLIGQTIIPFQSACFECFKTALNSINDAELKNVKALNRNNRKLGSFSPLSGIAASLAALDAFKVLIHRYDTLQQTNKRIEFNAQDFSFQTVDIERNPNCAWCGD